MALYLVILGAFGVLADLPASEIVSMQGTVLILCYIFPLAAKAILAR